MNKNNMHQIVTHYTEKFEMLNDTEHSEYYKWQVCYEFRPLMDAALKADAEDFADALYKVKECSKNIIDSYTQPFYGLVQFARKEPKTVQQMFMDLYADDGGDVRKQMELIQNFFTKSNLLLEKYYPNSHLYKQNSHSVSSYLFLYDPDHHYMYKATQSQAMADCIEFYDDWGTGDNIKLDVYYRMCDEMLAEMKKYPELLTTNKSRYDGTLQLASGKLHSDDELHILLFDIIYCCNVYDLFDGITFSKPKSKEKQLIVEQRKKAKNLKAEYDEAKKDADELNEIIQFFIEYIQQSGNIMHRTYGECDVLSVDSKYINLNVLRTGEEKKLGFVVALVNGIIRVDDAKFGAKRKEYSDILKKADNIPRQLAYAAHALEPYLEYLE